MIKENIQDIKKAVLYQHKALTKAVDICKADKFILIQNRINVRTILINLKKLEDLFIFMKHRNSKELLPVDTQILQDILLRPEMKNF